MASFSQLPSGRWRVMVRKSGVYKSGTFTTKKEAKDWAARLEAQADHIAANGFAPIRLVSHVDRRREKIFINICIGQAHLRPLPARLSEQKAVGSPAELGSHFKKQANHGLAQGFRPPAGNSNTHARNAAPNWTDTLPVVGCEDLRPQIQCVTRVFDRLQ